MDDVIPFRQKSLFVTRKNAVRLSKDEYFIADLIGMTVNNEENEMIGKVSDVMSTGANDVYEIKMKDGSFDLSAYFSPE